MSFAHVTSLPRSGKDSTLTTKIDRPSGLILLNFAERLPLTRRQLRIRLLGMQRHWPLTCAEPLHVVFGGSMMLPLGISAIDLYAQLLDLEWGEDPSAALEPLAVTVEDEETGALVVRAYVIGLSPDIERHCLRLEAA